VRIAVTTVNGKTTKNTVSPFKSMETKIGSKEAGCKTSGMAKVKIKKIKKIKKIFKKFKIFSIF